jgi:predicted nucleic acid-binding protein
VLIAVDTNVLLDLANDEPDVIDAVETIRLRLKAAKFIVPPTVLHELAGLYERGDAHEKRAAERALSCLREWGLEPLNLIAAGHGIVEQIGFTFRTKGILPEEEMNDSLIIAEAALLGCKILLSADAHLQAAQAHEKFRTVLMESETDGDDLIIATPRCIVRNFFPTK